MSATIALLVTASAAGPVYCAGHRAATGYIIAKSRYGNGEVKAQIRPTNLGWQVQLPGGRWVDCRRSCSETLRVETVDFWQANAAGRGQITNECGVFGCLELKYPR